MLVMQGKGLVTVAQGQTPIITLESEVGKDAQGIIMAVNSLRSGCPSVQFCRQGLVYIGEPWFETVQKCLNGVALPGEIFKLVRVSDFVLILTRQKA